MRFVSTCLLLAALLGATPAAADSILAKASYPEGPLWYKGKLYYAEMMQDRVMSSDLKTAIPFWSLKGCGPVGVAPYGKDGLLVLCYMNNTLVRLSMDGKTTGTISGDAHGKALDHPAAASPDDKGGVYLTASGPFNVSAPASGAVLYLDASGKLYRLAEGIHYANGIAFDREHKRLLVSEHLNFRVLSYTIGPDGTLSKPYLFADLKKQPRGAMLPDPLGGAGALTLDLTSGKVSVADYGGGRLLLFGPDGAWLGSVKVPMKYATGMTMLPDGRAAVTLVSTNSVTPYDGEVLMADDFLKRFSQ